jgi:hypothetical protein
VSIRQILVIDTNILVNAAYRNYENFPTSLQCRELLEAIFKICHKVALSPMLKAEWDSHDSLYAKQWRSRMAKRGKIILVDAVERPGIRQKVLARYEQAPVKQADCLKDFHLIEAAIEADRIIISLDSTARDLFAETCDDGDKLAEIMWVHPNEETILDWLEKGALPDPAKCLLLFRKA